MSISSNNISNKEIQININNFLDELNIALSQIDFPEDNDLPSVRNNPIYDEKYHKINSHVFLVSSISRGNDSIAQDLDSTICFSNKNTQNKHISIPH